MLTLASLTYGCAKPRDVPITVSVIGPALDAAGGTGAPAAVLRGATRLGLVGLDENGQPVPALAARWAISEDGLDTIFRLDDAAGIDAARVARELRAVVRRSRDPEARLLRGLGGVRAVTGVVIEMPLAAPRPGLLTLLAGPGVTLADAGPLRVAGSANGAVRLVARDRESEAGAVFLRGEKAGRAVARFAAGKADLLLGGTFADLAVARVANVGASLRFDEASGSFGLAPQARDGRFARGETIEALSLALDRGRIARLLELPHPPAEAEQAPLAERRARARASLGNGPPPPVRVALPTGPGADLLFRLLAADWAAIGVEAVRARPGEAADLKLIDLVAPPEELPRLACAANPSCDPADARAVAGARFIALGAPLRWSLVAAGLRRFSANSAAAHPLDRLR